jgi:hypothetical protein
MVCRSSVDDPQKENLRKWTYLFYLGIERVQIDEQIHLFVDLDTFNTQIEQVGPLSKVLLLWVIY